MRSGDWIVVTDVTLDGDSVVFGDIVVETPGTLTLRPGASLSAGDVWIRGGANVNVGTQAALLLGNLVLEKGAKLNTSTEARILATGDVTVRSEATIFIRSNSVLDVDFLSHHLRVEPGGKVRVKAPGGKIF